MQILVNGKSTDIGCTNNLAQYLEAIGLSHKDSIAVALNKEIVSREFYQQTPLSEGDELEIVKAIGGGT